MGISIEEYRKMLIKQNEKGVKNTSNPTKYLLGRHIRELGKEFEQRVQAICEIYELNNLARIEKTPEPMKILKHLENGKFETVFEKAAQPDFKGVIKGGRCVVFDAKFTESEKITFRILSDYQRKVLLKYDELGAIAFVLVGFINGAIYNIDIHTWEHMKEKFGRYYIKQEELEKSNFRAITLKNGLVDFLKICDN